MKEFKLTRIYIIPAKNIKEAEKLLRETENDLDVCTSFDEILEEVVNKKEN